MLVETHVPLLIHGSYDFISVYFVGPSSKGCLVLPFPRAVFRRQFYSTALIDGAPIPLHPFDRNVSNSHLSPCPQRLGHRRQSHQWRYTDIRLSSAACSLPSSANVTPRCRQAVGVLLQFHVCHGAHSRRGHHRRHPHRCLQ